MKNSTEQKKQDFAAQDAELQVIEKTKKCKTCKKIKTLKEYHKGNKTNCKICRNKLRRKTNRKHLLEEIKNIEGFLFCTTCKNYKKENSENFHNSKLKRRTKNSDHLMTCKKCRNKMSTILQKENIEKSRERHRNWRLKNIDHVREKSRKWKAKNKGKVRESEIKYMKERGGSEKRKEWFKVYYQKNRELMIAKSCAYDSRVRKSKPVWESQKMINEYYKLAKKLKLEVDHIVPINSDLVCGLHCLDNFQMLTREENASKGNRYWPNMP